MSLPFSCQNAALIRSYLSRRKRHTQDAKRPTYCHQSRMLRLVPTSYQSSLFTFEGSLTTSRMRVESPLLPLSHFGSPTGESHAQVHCNYQAKRQQFLTGSFCVWGVDSSFIFSSVDSPFRAHVPRPPPSCSLHPSELYPFVFFSLRTHSKALATCST